MTYNRTNHSRHAGIGVICFGFKQAEFNIVRANEIDEAAFKTYRYNLGNNYLVQGDIRQISVESIPGFDVLAAGFPVSLFLLQESKWVFKMQKEEFIICLEP